MRFILFLILIINPVYALDINQSVKSTIENNSKVKIALEKLNESKELIESAYGKKLPSVTGTLSGTYSSSDSQSATDSTTPETFTDKYKLTVSQNLYDGGFNNLEIDRSKILYDNEILYFKNTIQNLVLSAIEGYLLVINYKKSLEANKKNFDSVLQVLEEMKTLYDLGSATLYELQNAESTFAIAQTYLFTAEQNFKISQKTFNRIVGQKPLNLDEVIDFDEEFDLNNIILRTSTNNYDLLILKNDIKNKKILLAKEKQSKLPSLDLSASAEYSDSGRIDNGTKKTDGTIGLTLTIPIFKQNLDNSNIRKYQSQILQSELSYQDLISDLEIQASNLYKNYLISKVNIKSNLIRIQSIETSLEAIREEFMIGTKTSTDLIETESELLSVNVNYFDARKDFILNYFQIKALEGSLIDLFENYLPDSN